MSGIDAWIGFQQEIKAKTEELGLRPGEKCIYRGVSSKTHKLLPSLYRPECSQGRSINDLWRLESDLFFEFQARAHQVHGTSLSDWDYLFLMRHHGLPTRLLDWTEVLGVAIYFALLDQERDRSPCIWLLNPWGLNEKAWAEHRDFVAPMNLGWEQEPDGEWRRYGYSDILSWKKEIGWKLPVAIYPRQTNPRLAAQKGLFTIHGDEPDPIEKQVREFVQKVELPEEAIEQALDFLKVFGVDDYLLFPDLDGLARTLNKAYSLGGLPAARVTGSHGKDAEPKSR